MYPCPALAHRTGQSGPFVSGSGYIYVMKTAEHSPAYLMCLMLGGAYSPSTWTRSVNLALNDEYNHSWTFIGQSFIRRDAASYGFVVEDGYTTEDVS
jgi:hypothetical protein